jgi:hypothetical protein
MDRPTIPLQRGTEILTLATLGDTEGMLVGPENLARRRVNARGRIAGPVAGHLGEVYWVEHGDPGVGRACRAPYRVSESELVVQPTFTTQLDKLAGEPKSPSATTLWGAFRARLEGFVAGLPANHRGHHETT